MLHRLFPNWRLIALALAVSLGSPWAAAARADSPQATVVSPGGASQTLSLAALGSGDVVDRSYAVRSDAGEESRTVSGFSLAALLEAAGADPYAFSYLEVQRPSGGAVLLSRAQALSGGGDGPPVVYATAAGTAFLRPSAGAEDANAADCFEAPQGVTIVLRKGAALRLRAEASPRTAQPGEAVEFKAVVERSGAGEDLTYSWYFDDGHSASGPEASHGFAKPGSYDVVVGARASGEEAGASAVVTIQVGEPAGGPDRKGGGTSRKANAPDHGAASGGGDVAGGSTGAAANEAPNVPATPSAETVPSAPKPDPAAASPTPAAVEPERQKPKREAVERRPAAGERVSGELLAGAAASERKPPAQAAAARRGVLQPGPGGGLSVPAAAWGGLVTLGLLAAGALLEARGIASLWPTGRRGAS